MMQKEKLLKRSVLVATAAVCLTVAPTVVKAEGDESNTGTTGTLDKAGLADVYVDAKEGVLTATVLDNSNATEVLVGTGKTNKKGIITVSAWDVYETPGNEKQIEVDLSKLKNTTDNYLVLHTNAVADDAISIIKIPVAEKYVKAKYNAATELLQLGSGADSKSASPVDVDLEKEDDQKTAAKYEFRTAYSQWEGVENMPKLKRYQENGTQLFIRLKAETPVNSTNTTNPNAVKMENPDTNEKYTYNTESTLVPVYVAPHLPSKEVKVTIAAKAKGPSISANFTNGTVKIPKNAEYRLVQEDNSFLPGGKAMNERDQKGNNLYQYQPCTDSKEMTADEIFTSIPTTSPSPQADDATSKKAVLEVRKPATTKKAASKWSRLRIKTLDSLDGYVTEGVKDDTVGGKGIAVAKVTEESGEAAASVLDIKYYKSSSKADAVQDSFEVYNKGKYDYEIFVDENNQFGGEKGDPEGKLKKVTKVAKGKTKPVKISKKADGLTVWIRKAGDKKLQRWATKWARLGPINYEVVITPSPSPSLSPSPTPGTT